MSLPPWVAARPRRRALLLGIALTCAVGCVDDRVTEPVEEEAAPAAERAVDAARAAAVLVAIADARGRLVPQLPEPLSDELGGALDLIAAALERDDPAALAQAVTQARAVLEQSAGRLPDEVHLAATALAVEQAARLLEAEAASGPRIH